MDEACTHDCSTCGVDCPSRGIEKDALHHMSSVRKVVGIVSGKGGVGKSLVTSLMAVLMNRRGYRTAILDGDITGPSIPKMFGIQGKAEANEFGIMPKQSKMGTEIISANLLLENDSDPVVFRGPVISGTVRQFWSDVLWADVDMMFIDMPPGTGDVPLTVFQSLPVDGIIVVTSPQELVSMIVEKAVNMAKMMNVPILGLVENMSYVTCPDCGKQFAIFGESKMDETAKRYGIPVLGKLPIDPQLASQCDQGVIELFEGDWLDHAADVAEKLLCYRSARCVSRKFL